MNGCMHLLSIFKLCITFPSLYNSTWHCPNRILVSWAFDVFSNLFAPECASEIAANSITKASWKFPDLLHPVREASTSFFPHNSKKTTPIYLLSLAQIFSIRTLSTCLVFPTGNKNGGKELFYYRRPPQPLETPSQRVFPKSRLTLTQAHTPTHR